MNTNDFAWTLVEEARRLHPLVKPAHESPMYEKMRWLNYYNLSDLKIVCVDKIKSKNYAKSVLGNRIEFARTLQVLGDSRKSDSINHIILDTLPYKFMIKRNSGCQKMIFCWDKSKFDMASVKRRIESWGCSIPGLASQEYQYSLVEPLLFVEEILTASPEEDLTDYRFWCMNGSVKFIAMNTGKGMGGQIFVDKSFNKMDLYNSEHLPKDKNVFTYSKPSNFKEMIEAAEALSKPFKFVRVDLYSIRGKTYLGEFTFSPSGYLGRFINSKGESLDIEVGKMLQL